MENYRPPENRTVSGLTFFVTARLRHSLRILAEAEYAKAILDTFQFFRERREAKLYGYVVMPDHIHLIIRPLEPHTISGLMRRLKTFTAKTIGEGPIWGEGFWSEVVPNDASLRQKLNYVHANPVRAGLVDKPEEYAWSSASEYETGRLGAYVDSPFGPSTIAEAGGARRK
jgi:REP element-mobilizing transposase RayT